MNIVLDKKSDLTANLNISITADDYKEKVDKSIKDLQRKAQMPGFRPGKVPIGLIKKMYGKGVLAEEVNKVIVDAMYDFIKEKDLKVLGNPLPDNEKAKEIDWDNQTEFEFVYELGLSPEIDMELTDEIEVDYFKIKVEENTLEDAINELRKRHGKYVDPETSEAQDVLNGEFVELDGDGSTLADGLTNKSNIYIEYIKDDSAKESLVGKSVGDSVDLDLLVAVQNETEMASMLGVKKEELDQYGKNFRFTIEKISRVEPAEINQDLFKAVAPDEEIPDEKSFREFIAQQIQKQYQVEVDKHFKNQVIETLIKKADISLPEEFLKRWLLETNKDNNEITPEQVDKEFVSFVDSFKWQLIENHLIKKHKVEVSQEEVSDYLKSYMRNQLMQYGQQEPDDEILNDFVKRISSNEEEIKKVYDQLFDVKMLALFKEKLNRIEKEVSMDEFTSQMQEKYKKKKESVD